MNFINIMKSFFDNSKSNKLFLTVLPSLCGIIYGLAIFNSSILNGILIAVACVLFQISVQIFDDFVDWIKSKPYKRLELEQVGIRGIYSKGYYFFNDKKLPKIYFYISLLFFICAFLIFICVICKLKNIFLLFFLILMLLFGFIIYNDKFKKVLNFCGFEVFASFLCSFVSLISVYCAETRFISLEIVYFGIIIFFFEWNLFYTSSLLNIKVDKMTGQKTLPILIGKQNLQFILSVFLTFFPFMLTFLGIYFNIFQLSSAITFVLILPSIWFSILIYMYLKFPQKSVKWNLLMGIDSDNIKNEQDNISWYTVRYNFLRNIFIVYVIISIII